MIARLKRRRKRAGALFAGYSEEETPLKEYAVLMGGLNAGVVLALAATMKDRRKFPAEMNSTDFIVLCLAAHKLARLLSKDKVTSPLRAPFTRFVKPAGAGEVDESERGEGMRRVIGELVSCPYCTMPWAASLLVVGQALSPRATRTYVRILAVTAVGHFLHQAYARAKDINEQT